ncbi:MAG: hypothetical protein ACK5QH_00105 [Rubrivivax sp.]|jgi:hypothetical protein
MARPEPQPWWLVAWQQPATMAEHASAWAALLASEGPAVLGWWRRRLRWQQAAWACLGLGLLLAGVALLLAAMAQPGAVQGLQLLALCGVPGLPLLAAGGCWHTASRQHDGGARQRLLTQWQADHLLWQTGTPGAGR